MYPPWRTPQKLSHISSLPGGYQPQPKVHSSYSALIMLWCLLKLLSFMQIFIQSNSWSSSLKVDVSIMTFQNDALKYQVFNTFEVLNIYTICNVHVFTYLSGSGVMPLRKIMNIAISLPNSLYRSVWQNWKPCWKINTLQQCCSNNSITCTHHGYLPYLSQQSLWRNNSNQGYWCIFE